MGLGRLRDSLATVVRGAAVPYGYTVTVWSTGALLSHRWQPPGPVEIACFLVGATSAVALLRFLVRGREAPPEPAPRVIVLVGAVQVVAAAAALLAALAASLPGPPLGWASGGFAATLVFLAVASLDLSLLERGG